MSAMTLAAYATGNRPFDPAVAAVLVGVWPAFAFIANLVDPIP
jgi:hypothetical protein